MERMPYNVIDNPVYRSAAVGDVDIVGVVLGIDVVDGNWLGLYVGDNDMEGCGLGINVGDFVVGDVVGGSVTGF